MKHNFEPSKINYPDYVGVKLEGVGHEGVQNYKQFAWSNDLDKSDFHSKDVSRYLWMEHQGNLGLLRYHLIYPILKCNYK